MRMGRARSAPPAAQGLNGFPVENGGDGGRETKQATAGLAGKDFNVPAALRSRVWGSITGQQAGVLPCEAGGSARGMPAVSESCMEPSPVPWVSRAVGASLMGAQTPKMAEEETPEGPGAPQST